jgi:hypothetical protein
LIQKTRLQELNGRLPEEALLSELLADDNFISLYVRDENENLIGIFSTQKCKFFLPGVFLTFS